MRRLKMLGLALLTVFALVAVGAATAGAVLPTINVLSGETGEVTVAGAATGENIAELSTALAAPISCAKWEVRFVFPPGSSTGVYSYDCRGATWEGLKCNTPSDADGVILVDDTSDLDVGSPGAPFDMEMFLSAGIAIECGTLGKATATLKLTGGLLGKIEGVTEGTDLNSFKLNVKCTKPNNGKQEQKEFLNSEGKATKLILTANFGLGAESACLEVKEPVTLSLNKMAFFSNI